jgi:hypothetical protein
MAGPGNFTPQRGPRRFPRIAGTPQGGSPQNNVGPSGGRGQVLRFLAPYRVPVYLFPDEELPPAVVTGAPEDDRFLLSIPADKFLPQQPPFVEREEELVPSVKVDDDQRFDAGYRGYSPAAALFDLADELVVSILVDDDQRFDSPFSAYARVTAFVGDDDAWMASIGVDEDGASPIVAVPQPGGRLALFDEEALPPTAAATALEDGEGGPGVLVGYVAPPWRLVLFDEEGLPPSAPAPEDDGLAVRPAAYLVLPWRPASPEDELPPALALAPEDEGFLPPPGRAFLVAPVVLLGGDGDEQGVATPPEDDGAPLAFRAASGWLPRWVLVYGDGDEFAASQLALLVKDPRFLASDYGRLFAAAFPGNRFLAADSQRNFVGIDPEPQGARVSFDVKFVPEIVTLTFPFTNELLGATITPASPVITVTTVTGVDGNPANLLNGAAQIAAGLVLQSVKAGLDQCAYHFVCQVDLSDGRRLARTGTLQVKAP